MCGTLFWHDSFCWKCIHYTFFRFFPRSYHRPVFHRSYHPGLRINYNLMKSWLIERSFKAILTNKRQIWSNNGTKQINEIFLETFKWLLHKNWNQNENYCVAFCRKQTKNILWLNPKTLPMYTEPILWVSTPVWGTKIGNFRGYFEPILPEKMRDDNSTPNKRTKFRYLSF